MLSVPTSSSLDAKQMARVKEAAKRFNCKVESKLTDDATHLIVGNAADKVIERPKVDYYVAMMRGRWIVEFNCEHSTSSLLNGQVICRFIF